MDTYNEHIRQPSATPIRLEVTEDLVVSFADIPECDNELDFNSWRCTVCINEAIQPMFKMKGAAGVRESQFLNSIFLQELIIMCVMFVSRL